MWVNSSSRSRGSMTPKCRGGGLPLGSCVALYIATGPRVLVLCIQHGVPTILGGVLVHGCQECSHNFWISPRNFLGFP